MRVSHLLKLVYYLKAELRIFNVFNNNALNLLKKGKTSFLDLLTELNDLLYGYDKSIFVYLYHKIVLTFYSFILSLNIVNLLTIGFID